MEAIGAGSAVGRPYTSSIEGIDGAGDRNRAIFWRPSSSEAIPREGN
jgi:hypothetical protein